MKKHLHKVLTTLSIRKELDHIVAEIAYIMDLEESKPENWRKLEEIRKDFDRYTEKLWGYLNESLEPIKETSD
jgi:hypothetical protein